MMQVVSVTVIGALTLLAGHLLVSLVFWLVDRSHRSVGTFVSGLVAAAGAGLAHSAVL